MDKNEIISLVFTIVLMSICFGPIIYFVISSIYHIIKDYRLDLKRINEESFQRYAKFYGNSVPNDKQFDEKLNNIYVSIIRDKQTDIKEIANNCHCTLEECVLKIRYLKNKRIIGDYYIDTQNLILLPCSSEDQKLLDKYKPYIYNSHLQISEIANYVSNKEYKNIDELKQGIFDDLTYLDKKGLINGIKIDEVDKKIIYYTIEKRKTHESYESLHCPNCGAINDVDTNGKVRCSYCKTIIKGSNYNENENY